MGNIQIKRENYNSLDGLRAYSAVGIAMMHFLANIKGGQLAWMPANHVIGFFTKFVQKRMLVSE